MIKKLLLTLSLLLFTLWFMRVPLAESIATAAIGEEVTFETLTPTLFGATLTNVTLKTKQATLKAKELTLSVKPFTLLTNRLIIRQLLIQEPTITLSIIPKRLDEAFTALVKPSEKKELVSTQKAVTVEMLHVTNLTLRSDLPKIDFKLPSLTLHNIHSDQLPLKEQLVGELIKQNQTKS